MTKHGLHIVLFFVCSCLLRAQDIHFSQYYLSPLSLNPANTGNYRGDFRFFANYRTQWRDLNAYNSFSAGGDFNVFPRNLNFSGGIIFINDRSGGNLNVNKIMPSAAYHVKLQGIKLHAGLQPGLVIKSVDFSANSYPNQLNWLTGGFDKTMPNIESNVGQRFAYLDVNAGVGASTRIGKFEPEFALALFHLNRPKENFVGNVKNNLPLRYSYNFGLSYFLSEKTVLRYHNLYGYTGSSSDWVSGINIEYGLSNDAFFSNSVYAGFMWRTGFGRNFDAGIVTTGLNYKHYTLGFSYDLTFSKLRSTVGARGAFEMALIYRGKSSRLIQKAIPCERY